MLVTVSSIITKAHEGGGSKKKDKHMIAVAMLTAYYAVAGLLGLAYADYKKPGSQQSAEVTRK